MMCFSVAIVCSSVTQDTQRISRTTAFGTEPLVMKYQFIRRNPTGTSGPPKALCKRDFGRVYSTSPSPAAPSLLLPPLVIRASPRCEGNAANWNVFMHKNGLLNAEM